MKKYQLLVLILFVATMVPAQKPVEKINTKYLRPSVTLLFTQPRNEEENLLVNKFRPQHIFSKFDNHPIEFRNMKRVESLDLQKMKLIESYIREASNPIIAKWWSRDENGNFSFSLVANRGVYTATDADAIISRSSSTSRLEMLGEQLIDRSYILLYEITDLYDMEEYYNRIEARNRKNKNFTQVKRTDEGYHCKYTVYVYKLNFNDSVAADFYSKYWVDSKNQDSKKVASWADARFPVKLMTSSSGEVSATQSKAKILNVKKKTMNELIEDLPAKIQENTMFELGRKLEDFKLKVTVYKAYPVSAKLGTKEDLYIDQRFYVYEIEQMKNGSQVTNRMGVVRAKKIIDNKAVATGESKPSVFRQVQGKRLYPGMYMESNDDLGMILNLGYSSSGNKALGGFYAGADFRISRIVKRSGWHLGIDAAFASLSDIDAGSISTEKNYLTSAGELCSGSTYAISVNVSKEIYLTRKGNLYLRPQFGVGMQNYSISKVGTLEIDSDNKNYNWSSIYVPMGIGIGWNITSAFCLEFKPSIYFRMSADTDNKERLNQDSKPLVDNWGFGSIDKTASGSGNTICLRIRL